MLRELPSAVSHAALERLTLLLNHVIASEPSAAARLRPHSGATLRVRAVGWPSPLPALPDAVFRVTPAGLLEWIPPGESPTVADLEVEAEASNPFVALTGLFTGARPRVDVAGNAALAADVNWLIDNLRWDLQDDLAQWVGPGAAQVMGQVAHSAAAALNTAVRAVSDLTRRNVSEDAGTPPAR